MTRWPKNPGDGAKAPRLEAAPHGDNRTATRINAATRGNDPTTPRVNAATHGNDPAATRINAATRGNDPTTPRVNAATHGKDPAALRMDAATCGNDSALAGANARQYARASRSCWAVPMTKARGFTLIEVLVALLILGIMSALGYGTYRAARISAERTEESLQRTREIEFGMRILVMDFAQMVPRPVRDPLGQSRLPALRGSSGNGTSASISDANSLGTGFTQHFNSGPGFQSTFSGSSSTNALPLADLTRGGWSNTAGQQRSTLQRVSYALVGEVVKRSYTTELDTVQASQPLLQDLLSGVKTIQFRYMDANQAWQNQWPPASIPLNEGMTIRPVAVEVTIEFKDWGKVRRLIEVAG